MLIGDRKVPLFSEERFWKHFHDILLDNLLRVLISLSPVFPVVPFTWRNHPVWGSPLLTTTYVNAKFLIPNYARHLPCSITIHFHYHIVLKSSDCLSVMSYLHGKPKLVNFSRCFTVFKSQRMKNRWKTAGCHALAWTCRRPIAVYSFLIALFKWVSTVVKFALFRLNFNC